MTLFDDNFPYNRAVNEQMEPLSRTPSELLILVYFIDFGSLKLEKSLIKLDESTFTIFLLTLKICTQTNFLMSRRTTLHKAF